MIENLQQHFVNPLGLLGLLAIIPLVIFYLVKPKPEEEVMPSMAFFSEDQKKGRIQNALQALKRNRMLLLHIMFISLAALAIANPLVPGLESDGRTVVILDTSASVHGDMEEVKEFALEHLGETNTVITASQDPEIAVEQASTEEARESIQDAENKASGTDLVSALQLASNYGGRLVLASDMSHTADNRNLENAVDNLAAERTVKAMDLNHENSHGFTDLEFEGGEAEVTVRNFLDRNRSIEVQLPDGSRSIDIGPRTSETISLELSGGTHELSLPPDEFALDNNLHVSVPEDQEVTAARLGDESRYFRQAIQLINSTTYTSADSIGGADVYFIGKGFELTNERREKLRNEIEVGAAVVFEARQGIEDFAPVENSSDASARQVSVPAGGVTSSFNSSVIGYDVTGEALASPEEALVLSEDEDVLLYNVDDGSFGQRINYPIFWKQVIHRMTDLKTGEDLNLETGEEHTFEDPLSFRGQQVEGYTRIEGTGFYRGEPTYSANLVDADESTPHVNRITSRTDIGDQPGSDPAQKYLAALLAIIGALEITYLSRRGELR